MVGLEEYVDRFSWNKVLVFNIGFDRKGTEGLHWVYVPEEKFRFYRVGFYDNILGTDKMSLYVEVGLSKDAEVDVEQEFDEVVMDLRKSGLISDEQIVCYEPVLMDPAYVQNISSALRARGIYTIGRYGGWKYCSIEDNIIEAKQTAELFNLMSFHKCGGIDLG
jgi:protoporphyrinogen oxidase